MVTDLQAVEGYGCNCGYKVHELADFRRHLINANRKGTLPPGAERHKSIGRVNMQSGDVVLPPYVQRTQEEKIATTFAIGKNTPPTAPVALIEKDEDEEEKPKPKKEPDARITSDANNAVGLKVVPRVMSINYTNIMRTAQIAAHREWGWREDMPLENFLDTCLANFFKEHGLTLGGYFKEEKGDGDGFQQEIRSQMDELREMMFNMSQQVQGVTQIVHALVPAG